MILVCAAGLLIPFIGTTVGSACVYFMKEKMAGAMRGILCGFAAGVMTAASVWSLLIPAMEAPYTVLMPDWFPAIVGFWVGVVGLLWLDRRLQTVECGNGAIVQQDKMLLLAVTLHNLPEGMAVGAVAAGYLFGKGEVSSAAVLALAIGIGLQNFPEGAIVSMPLHLSGIGKTRSFAAGTLSGAIEPLGGALMLVAADLILPLLPYLLGFAAGAMVYVALVELIPETWASLKPSGGVLSFSAGFTIMMLMDCILSK